ncbi:B-box zinc finger protein (macronuclear) [Tetrahymena thermophila SB210]|uniref:B-box zinc finger protein n=1 Tax=Tetrahymena thermophila (strain SB210) TaxID=312017 RepID=I7M7H4_TETTS|nr:B-box zinc finger protein [Tetrahymena thermophila SB210]EAR93006.1 B-box zinc finger protein [Tetrahymena thermophila SB210]|eukprot:XP_001013251.1 B-box zinc finger protein [Tetrahymena thermophila SB210]
MIQQGNYNLRQQDHSLFCNLQNHEGSQLSYVCIQNGCIDRGLVCQICATTAHKDHNIQPLTMFLNTYKESCQLSQAIQELKRDSQKLELIQQELSNYLDNFSQSLQEIVLSAKKRISTNIECDRELIDSIFEVEQKHLDHINQIESQMINQPGEAQEKIQQLISRLKYNNNQNDSSRFQVTTFREDNIKAILLLTRKNNSIRNNILSETPKFAKDLYLYLRQIDQALEAYDAKRANQNLNNQSQLDITATNRSVSPMQGISYSTTVQQSPQPQQQGTSPRSASGSRTNIFSRQGPSIRSRMTDDKQEKTGEEQQRMIAQNGMQSYKSVNANPKEILQKNNSNSGSQSNLNKQNQQQQNSILPVSYLTSQQMNQPLSQNQQISQEQLQQNVQLNQQPQKINNDPIYIQQQYQIQQQPQKQHQPQQNQSAIFQPQKQLPIQQKQQNLSSKQDNNLPEQQQILSQQNTNKQQLANPRFIQSNQIENQEQLEQLNLIQKQVPSSLAQQKIIHSFQNDNLNSLEQIAQQPFKEKQDKNNLSQQPQKQLQLNQMPELIDPTIVSGSGNHNFSSRPKKNTSNSPLPRPVQKLNTNLPAQDQNSQAPKIGSHSMIQSINLKENENLNTQLSENRPKEASVNAITHNYITKSDSKGRNQNIQIDTFHQNIDINKFLQNQIKPATPPKHSPKQLQINSSSPLQNKFNIEKKQFKNDSTIRSSYNVNSASFNNGGGGSKSNLNTSPQSQNASYLDLSRVAYNQIQQSMQMSHDGKIKSIELIGNDKIASGGDDKLIKIWERTQYKLLNTLEGHNASITVIKYHNMSRILASGGDDDLIIIWKPVPVLQKVHILKGHEDSITSMAFQNERTLISSSKDMKLIVWDIEKGLGKNKLDYSESIINEISIYNKMILCVSEKYVQFWELSTYKLFKKVEAHDDTINQISLIHRKRKAQIYIVTCSNDGCIYVWDGDNQYDEVDQIKEESSWSIKCFDYNSHYDLIVYGCNSKVDSQSKVVVYSLEQQKITQTISHYTDFINQIKCIYKDIYIALENNFIDNVKIQKNQPSLDY